MAAQEAPAPAPTTDQPAAQAPTSPTTTTQPSDQVVKMAEYRVTAGFAGSLAAAAEVKESMPTITEVIAAEDIGKLPDISIADSLTRITGVAGQRTNGRTQQINIRGLTGDFSTGMLNGREQVSTDENRSIDFDQYPAELLNEVVVYKTAAPDLTGQGLAGSVDLRTVQPLSKSGRTIAVGGYYQMTQYGQLTPGAKKTGERFNVAYIDQLADGKVGIAIGFAHTVTPWEGKQFQAWGGGGPYPTDNGNFVLGGTKSYVRTTNLKRDGLMGVLEFKPNDYIHSTVDVYVSSFEEKSLLRGMEIPLYWSGAHLQPGYTVVNGLATTEVFTNVQPIVRNDVFKRTDSPFAIGWNLAMGEKSEWPIVFDVGYSRVARTDQDLETWSGLGTNGNAAHPDTMTVKLIPGQIPVITPTLNYADGSILKLTDPQGWNSWYGPATANGDSPGYLKFLQAKDELGQFKLSTKHQLKQPLDSIEFGVSYSDRYKRDGEGPSGFVVNANGVAAAPMPPMIGTTDMTFLGLGRIYAYDPLAAYSSGALGFVPNNNFDYVAQRFDVTEKIAQFFAQLNLDTKLGDLPLSGNIGFRVINTDQKSKGYSRNGSTNQLNLVTGGAKYTNFAPALNLDLKVDARTHLRFSAARQIARPRMYDMRAATGYGFDPTLATSTDINRSPWSGGGGNPKLRPWLSDSLDLSFEKYFKESKGYIAIAGFNKRLLSYIYNQSILGDFTGYPVTGPVAPALHQGSITGPANGAGGNMRGLEVTISLASELLNKNIKGFGVVMGGAYTDSTIKPWGPTGGDAPIAGLSRKVANFTLYYERAGFSARVSEHYRSSNRQYITTFGPPSRGSDVSPGDYSTAQAEKVVDAQVSYTFQSGPVKGLTIYLQGYNLNDEPLVTLSQNDPRMVMNYQKYGASYSIGASYKF